MFGRQSITKRCASSVVINCKKGNIIGRTGVSVSLAAKANIKRVRHGTSPYLRHGQLLDTVAGKPKVEDFAAKLTRQERVVLVSRSAGHPALLNAAM
jgi:hypothetical protein